MNKICILCMCSIFVVCLTGCKKNDSLKWTNEEAIYVYIDKAYGKQVLDNLSGTFKDYNYKKVFVVEKSIDDEGLADCLLLFIVNGNLEECLNQFKNDEKVSSCWKCKDLPYEAFDYRYLQCDKDKIQVGDTFTIALKGDCDLYYQSFSYQSFFVKPVNYDENKTYRRKSFPKLHNIAYISNEYNGIYIGIKKANYYDLIQSMDILARSKDIQLVEFNYIDVIRPIWEIDKSEQVIVVEERENSITLQAELSGVLHIRFDGIECTIEIVDKDI